MKRVMAIAYIVWLDLLRKKDLYVLFILLAALLVTLVSLNIFGLGHATGYVKDIGLLLTWIFGWILSVSITARQLPTEESRRTIFPLLAKPLTRGQLIMGKWVGAWSVVASATAAFYILTTLIVVGMGGHLPTSVLLQAFALHATALGVVCAMALVFSTRMNSDAASTLTYVLSGASFLIVPRIPQLMAKESGLWSDLLLVLYNLLPHFEAFDMRRRIVHDYGRMPPGLFALSLLYGIVLIASFLLIAWIAYRKKHFSRGSML